MILKTTLRFSCEISFIPTSTDSLPVHRDGRASAELIAISDFLIWKSRAQSSGLTVNPLLSVLTTLTVIVSPCFLFLKKSNGSFWVWRCPTLTFCSEGLISRTLTFTLSPFLYLPNSSSPLFKNVKSFEWRKASTSISSTCTNSAYSFLLTTTASVSVPTGKRVEKISNGFSWVNL